MKLKRRDIRVLIEGLLSEVGLGVGMDPTGATMPRGMKRSEYNQLEDANATVEDFLMVAEALDPTLISTFALAGYYYVQGKPEEAALVLALSAGGLAAGGMALKFGKFINKAGIKGGKEVTEEMIEQAGKSGKSMDDIVDGLGKPVNPNSINAAQNIKVAHHLVDEDLIISGGKYSGFNVSAVTSDAAGDFFKWGKDVPYVLLTKGQKVELLSFADPEFVNMVVDNPKIRDVIYNTMVDAKSLQHFNKLIRSGDNFDKLIRSADDWGGLSPGDPDFIPMTVGPLLKK